MANYKRDLPTYKRITSRQEHDPWTVPWEASIFANPQECPGISRGARLTCTRIRDFATGNPLVLNALSSHEENADVLALFHPSVWYIKDQPAIPRKPSPHPLKGHPKAKGMTLTDFSGSVATAERMGQLDRHITLNVFDPESGEWGVLPFPYLGDALLFVEDDDGVFVLNWSIKDKWTSFRRRGPGAATRPSIEDDEAVIFRHELERLVYDEAGIRTQQVAGEEINVELRNNLNDLFQAHSAPVSISGRRRNEAIVIVRAAVGTKEPAYKVAKRLSEKFGLTLEHARNLIKQAIWRREVRIDLFRPFLMDGPFHPEELDPLVRYAHWFSRKGV